MALQDIDVTATSTASPAAVWALLGDSATWPRWTSIERHEGERPGDADGLGEIRVFTTGRYVIREEIVERVPEQRLTYVLLSGLPLKEYRAEIDLTPDGAGTTIRWHTTFAPKVPGSGWLFRRSLGKLTREFVDGLAAAASAG